MHDFKRKATKNCRKKEFYEVVKFKKNVIASKIWHHKIFTIFKEICH